MNLTNLTILVIGAIIWLVALNAYTSLKKDLPYYQSSNVRIMKYENPHS